MPAPSQLSIAMGAVTRLIKEKASYHDEMEQQRAWLDSHTTDDLDEDSDLYFEIQQRVPLLPLRACRRCAAGSCRRVFCSGTSAPRVRGRHAQGVRHDRKRGQARRGSAGEPPCAVESVQTCSNCCDQESSEQMRGDASADEVAAAHVVVDDAKRALREPV